MVSSDKMKPFKAAAVSPRDAANSDSDKSGHETQMSGAGSILATLVEIRSRVTTSGAKMMHSFNINCCLHKSLLAHWYLRHTILSLLQGISTVT